MNRGYMSAIENGKKNITISQLERLANALVSRLIKCYNCQMIKFIHKKHIHESDINNKIIIYYNVSDIFLGATLLILVVFFIHDYLSHTLTPKNDASLYMNQNYKTQPRMNIPVVKP